MTAQFNDAAINQVFDKIVSYMLSTARFKAVNQHEPKSAPGNQLTGSVWVDAIRPVPEASGIASTSGVVDLQARIYMPFTAQPFDMIDPTVLATVTDMMGALTSDFSFGGAAGVRALDLLGMYGGGRDRGLSARAGYVEIDRHIYRVMTVFIPVIVNDMFVQVP